MHKCYIGIDNGQTGSVGIICPEQEVKFFRTPSFSCQDYTKQKKNITRLKSSELYDILIVYAESYDCFVGIERPLVNPTRFTASASALRFHESTLAVIELLELPYQFFDSKEWQRVLLPRGISGEQLKSASLEIGNRLFPQFKQVKHPDRDGLLLAEYLKRQKF